MATERDSTSSTPQLNGLGLPRSNRPLFAAKNRERNLFGDEPKSFPTGDEDAKISRIPRSRTFPLEGLQGIGSGNGRESIRPSPPRAATTLSIKSAYEKVVRDEENMKAGGSTDNRDIRDGSPSPAARTRPGGREADERRMGRLRTGRPVTLGKEKMVSPLGRSASQPKVHDGDDDLTDITNASFSTGSVSGSVHTLSENSTDDEIRKKINNFARDQERAKAAIGSGTGLFAKAGVSTRVAETAHSLTRRSNGSNMGNEPTTQKPVQWGSRARKSNNLLQRIMSPDSSGEGEVLPPLIIENSIEWAGVAEDVPIPFVEGGSSTARELTPPDSRPPTSVSVDTDSPEKSQFWDADLDFTARSLQLSTSPKLKIRSNKLDNIVAREQEMLSKRALATIRLEEIRERNSEDRSTSPESARKPSLLELSTAAKKQEKITPLPDERDITFDSPVSHFAEPRRGRRSPSEPVKIQLDRTSLRKPSPLSQEHEQVHEKTILDEEGEAIPGTPITVFRNSTTNGGGRFEPESKHTESFDALRKLARIASTSPTPDVIKSDEPGSHGPSRVNLAAEIYRKEDGGSSTPPKSDVDPEERIAAEASLFELPDIKSERNSVREPSPISERDLDETPRPKRDSLSVPTPVVIGAFIETPAPILRKPKLVRPPSPPIDLGDKLQDEVSRLTFKDFNPGPSTSDSDAQTVGSAARIAKELVLPAPSMKPTVLELKKRNARPRPLIKNTANPVSVKDDLRRIQQEAQIDDSTLDDFDDLLAADADDFDLDDTTALESKADVDKDERGNPLTDRERERRLEMLAYERMNNSLKNGLNNIRDAKKGIERLESRVSSSPKSVAATPFAPTECNSCTLNSGYHLTLDLPRLWTRDSGRWNGFRFTWVGLALFLVTTWYVSETITCEYICHPTYATTSNWSYEDPFWGGALPTLADRLSGGMLSVLRNLLWDLIVIVWKGWTGVDMSVNPGRPRSALTPPVWSEGSMFEDEAI